jgi:thioredoxin 1
MRDLACIATRIIYSILILMSCLSGFAYAETADNMSTNDLQGEATEITFLEFGSVKCLSCKQMQPIMEAIASEYAGKVKVVFHDVWAKDGKEIGRKYSIRLIPTQVFLDKNGIEIARHEGFFPREEIEKLLAENGVSR